jgi:hypothetical protein
MLSQAAFVRRAGVRRREAPHIGVGNFLMERNRLHVVPQLVQSSSVPARSRKTSTR